VGAAAEQDHDSKERTVVGRRDPLLGTLFDGRFRVDAKIAAGGFGAIYRATHLKSGHEFALKVLHANLTHDARVVARFRREGVALTRLRDPHTITAYELGETPDGTLYIVMELLHGESLYERFRTQGPLPWPRVMAIARSVCSSLAEAHAHGIIHRDLKPTNIHLEPRGADRDYVKVLDFGIAKILHDSFTDSDMDASDLTQAGQMIGTLDYMSPEQMVGGGCTQTTDIYTLGIVMYEMLAGHKPFEDANSAAAALASVLTTTPQPLCELDTAMPVPLPVDRLVLKCLERLSSDRYQSAVELAMGVDDILSGRINLPTSTATAAVRPIEEVPTAPVPTAASVRPAPAAVRAAVEARRSREPSQPPERPSSAWMAPPADRRHRAHDIADPDGPAGAGLMSHGVDRAASPQLAAAGESLAIAAERAPSPPLAALSPSRPSSPQILPRSRRGSMPQIGADGPFAPGGPLGSSPSIPNERSSTPSNQAAAADRASSPSIAPPVDRAVTPQILPRNRRGSAPQIPPPASPAAERPRRGSEPQIVAVPPSAPPIRASTPQLAVAAAAPAPMTVPRPMPPDAPNAPSANDPPHEPTASASTVDPTAMRRLLTPPPRIPITPGGSAAKSLREAYPTIHLQPPSAMRPPLTAFDDRPTTAIGQLSPAEMARTLHRKATKRRVVYGAVAAIVLAVAATILVVGWALDWL
jgi:tRNA A-37 threonylcarbamoyl transferase component Bud32